MSAHQTFIISGTDTEIGKTVFSAMLTKALGATYWKPVQSGLTEERTDTETVQALTGLPDNHFIPEGYKLKEPLSPHRAAELGGVRIEPHDLFIPPVEGPLVIEGAGGLLVPLTRDTLYIDVFQRWKKPVILCTRTTLGTINHTLLSVEALRKRAIPLLGLVFIGEDNLDNIRTISEFACVKVLGRVPRLDSLNSKTLNQTFDDNFERGDFT